MTRPVLHNNKRRANHIETMVVNRLRANGFLLVTRVYDHWRPVEPARKKGLWLCSKGGDKLVGDVQAMSPDGRMVLVECKRRSGRLVFSAFAGHQVSALETVARNGGISLVAWFDHVHLHIMRWSDMGLAKGEPGLTKTQAFALNLNLRAIYWR